MDKKKPNARMPASKYDLREQNRRGAEDVSQRGMPSVWGKLSASNKIYKEARADARAAADDPAVIAKRVTALNDPALREKSRKAKEAAKKQLGSKIYTSAR